MLAEQGLLRAYPHRALGLFPARTYPIVDASAATDPEGRREGLLNGAESEIRTAAPALLVIGPKHIDPVVSYGRVPARPAQKLRDRLWSGGWADDSTRWTIRVLTATTGNGGRRRVLWVLSLLGPGRWGPVGGGRG